jgi:hypothetical protein
MSRIRSVHPGLFTDEAFVCLSDAAQIFFIGLWTECDDQGAFEWKPVQLRLKLRGNRDGSIEPLLAELEAAGCICNYQHEGRKYGLVRNFQRFQRPKKPNSVHFIPPQFRTFVGLKADGTPPPQPSDDGSSPPAPHQFPTSGEKSPQMEEEGGRREEEKGGEREEARAQESEHAKVCQDILDRRAADLDKWELDFLVSIKWKPSLSKSQSDSLKTIQAKLGPVSGKPYALPTVTRGTPAYDAWIAYYRRQSKTGKTFHETKDAFTVPSEFPPQEKAA